MLPIRLNEKTDGVKSILIPLDLSLNVVKITEKSLHLFNFDNILIKIFLFNTYQVHNTNPENVVAINDSIRKAKKEKLEAEKTKIRNFIESLTLNINSDIKGSTFIGTTENVLNNIVSSEHFDLVVFDNNELSIKQNIIKKVDSSCNLLLLS